MPTIAVPRSRPAYARGLCGSRCPAARGFCGETTSGPEAPAALAARSADGPTLAACGEAMQPVWEPDEVAAARGGVVAAERLLDGAAFA